MFFCHEGPVDRPTSNPALTVAVGFMASLLATPVPADPMPNEIFGNYAGAGPCTASAPKPCTDTSVMDNIYIERLDFKYESEQDRQLRESLQQKRSDARVAIRVVHDHGHSCTLEGEMYWARDHLEFKEEPPAHGTVPGNCKMEMWFTDGKVTMRDPGKGCEESFCSVDGQTKFDGRRFVKGPDKVLAAPTKSNPPAPKTIFGFYRWAGNCASDERKTEFCTARNKNTDYIDIKPSETADAHVTIDRKKGGSDEGNYCELDADAKWLGNHLVFIKEKDGKPGSPDLLEFWFKNDTVVVRDVWGDYCGALIQGAYFRKTASPKVESVKH